MKGRHGNGRKRNLSIMIIMGALLLGAALSPLSTTMGQGGDVDTLVSLYVETAPTLDGIADEAAWADAEPLTVNVVGGGANGDVVLKSVFTDTDVYIYAEWDDDTMSLTRGGGAWVHNPLPEDTMRAVFVDEAPVIDGDVSDEAWAAADPLTISLTGGTMPGDITIKALYDDDKIYVQKTWDDPTFSIARSGSWSWDDVGQMWEHPDGHSEDRANIQWDIDATGFAEQGCLVKCHIDSYSYLDNPDDTTDMWHMKAARSLPANGASQVGTPTLDGLEATAGEFHLDGWTDDKYVAYDENQGAEEDGGRHGDAGSSTYSNNRNATRGAPNFIETDPVDWIDAMVLLQSEIDGGETITADPEDPAYVGVDVAAAWAKYDALGAVVPERVLSPPDGSRGDIHEAAIWKDGTWTVELERDLVTGNDDDVQFDDMDKTYHFGVSTIDDGGGADHNYHSGAYHMVFAPEFENFGSGSEDRLALLFEIGTITDFATDGCMVKCHPSDGSAGAYLEVDGEMGDIWHMKAARSLPVTTATQTGTVNVNGDHEATSGKFMFEGYIDDKNLQYDEEPHEEDGGRHGDDGTSTYGNNRNAERTGPMYMEKDPLDYLDAMVLTQAEIDDGQVWEIATATPEELEQSWELYEDFGALIPERILREPDGSRADIMQAAVWEDGTWSTEIKRKLVTGNSDDVQFDDLDASYRFGVALMDNAGGGSHSTSATETFLLEFYIPPTEYVLTGGPITDKKGMPIEGALVTLELNGETFTGTTDGDGNVSITVPATWADNAVQVTITRKGYDDAEFGGSISADGEFTPVGGSYPDMVKEKKEDESPGFSVVVLMSALVIATLTAISFRKR